MTACFTRLILAGAAIASWELSASAAVQTIALRGDFPAGTGEDATFGSFTTPSLNNRGQVAFGAQLTGGDVNAGNDTGYWIAAGGSFHSVIREGAAASGMPAGTVFGNAPSLFTGYVSLNDAGEIAVGYAVTLPDSSASSGVWIGNHQSLSLLATQGSAAPGAENGAAFFGLSNVRASLNRRGDVAFNANLNVAPYTTINSNNYSDGLWVLNRSGTVATILAGHSAAPLGENAQIVGFSTFTHPTVNRHGDAAFNALHRLPAGPSYQPSVWTATDNGIELRGAFGQPLPEAEAAATISHVSQPGFNAAGTTVFNGNFSNAGGTPAFGSFIMVSDADGYSLQAYSGGPASGLPGHEFQSTSYPASLGSGGHIAFLGSTSDGTTSLSGVWTGRPNELQPVALQGTIAPNANATFGAFFRSTPAVNRFGQIAFPSGLTDLQSGATSSSLWATDLDGNLIMIARTGETLEVADGDVRTVSGLSMLVNHGDDDGRPRGMNDLGQIAFHANFTDGSRGIFLSDAVAHLPGDYNGDHAVDTADYLVWRKAVATQDPVADGDRDGSVGENDRALWSEYFGMSLQLVSGEAGTSVPEPEAALLFGTFYMVTIFRRRGKEPPVSACQRLLRRFSGIGREQSATSCRGLMVRTNRPLSR